MKPAIMKRFSDMASTAKLASVAAAADLSVAVDGLSDVARGRDTLVAVAPGEAFVHPEFLALVLAAAADRVPRPERPRYMIWSCGRRLTDWA